VQTKRREEYERAKAAESQKASSHAQEDADGDFDPSSMFGSDIADLLKARAFFD
jgi:hypothetical protein